MRARRIVAVAAAVLVAGTAARAQYYQTDFSAEEFRSRQGRVFDETGTAAVAVVQGVAQTEGFTLPRQHNTIYYLSGIETPGAYLLLDGRTRRLEKLVVEKGIVQQFPAVAASAIRRGTR